MRKKLICLLLTVLMLLSAFPVTVLAEAEHIHSRQLVEVVTSMLSPTAHLGKFICSECGETYYAEITPEDVGMPIIDIDGSLLLVTKQNTEVHTLTYTSPERSFTSNAELKVQGNSSAFYPKKNYTVKLLDENGEKNKVTLVDSWGKQSKYCLKANFIDFTQARNIVSARIFNQILHSRGINDELGALPNGGLTDGFPVLVYNDGSYLGLYTLNIPKDNWMFGMKKGNGRQALLFGSDRSTSTKLESEIPDVAHPENVYWDIEFCSTEDDPEIGTAWACESMNDFIRFLVNNEGENFKAGIEQYTDVDRAIDVFIYTYFCMGTDNYSKNMIWATYDGTKWIPCVYDLDSTWGINWLGQTKDDYTDSEPGSGNLLFRRLLENYYDEIKLRYYELRSGILSDENILAQFDVFVGRIPETLYKADAAKWLILPGADRDNMAQIRDCLAKRGSFMDAWYANKGTDMSEEAYCVDFRTPVGMKLYNYVLPDQSEAPGYELFAWSTDENGELTMENGQVYFRLDIPDGRSLDSITVSPAEGYTALEGPDETGIEGMYRISGISDNLRVDVSLIAEEEPVTPPEPTVYTATFDCGGNADIYVYPHQDYSLEPQLAASAVAVDSDTGEAITNGDGQVNFLVVPHKGYEVSGVSVSPNKYKNIKGPEDTGRDNTYRITKISGDLTVTVSLAKTGESEDEGFKVSFDHDDSCSVLVYPGQDYSVQPTECTETFSLDADSGVPTKNGKGQVNFTVVPADGYAISSVSVSPDCYKNIKGPEDTGLPNTYRITKISGDLTVSIETEKLAPEPAAPTLRVISNAKSIDIGDSAVCRAAVTDMPEGAKIKWTVSGSLLHRTGDDGHSMAVLGVTKGTVTVTAVLAASDGSVLCEDSAQITVNKLNLTDKITQRAQQIILSINYVQVLKDALKIAIKSEFWKYF